MLRTWRIYISLFILVFTFICPGRLFGEKGGLLIEVKDNARVSADLKNADVSEALRALGSKSGLAISVGDGLSGKTVTASFTDLDMESALETILENFDHVLVFSRDPRDEKLALNRVYAGFYAEAASRASISFTVPYGEDEGYVGAVNAGEGAITGPSSFAVDDKGDIYICDTVNERVQIYSSGGAYISSIQLEPGTWAADVAIDDNGYVYIYDDLIKRLYLYGPDGVIHTGILVDNSRWLGQGPTRVDRDNIFMYTCTRNLCGDFLIGRIAGDRLVQPSAREIRMPIKEGMQAPSGRRYATRGKIREQMKMEITEQDGIISQRFVLKHKGVLSIRVLGESRTGDFFIVTESNSKDGLAVGLHKFNREGIFIRSMKLPPGSIFYWSVKNYSLSKDGTVYGFIPEKDRLIIEQYKF